MGRVDIYPSSVLQLPPSAMLGVNNLATDFAVVGAGPVTVTDMTVTVTVPAGRQLKIGVKSQLKSTATSGWTGDVFDNGSNVGRVVVGDFTSVGRVMMDGHVILSPTAGTHTYDLRLARFGGTGDLTIEGTGGGRYLEVEDVTGTLWNGSQVTAGMVASEQWTAYTPTWVQSATISNTVLYSRYIKLGRTVIFSFSLQATSAGTATNSQSIVLPFTPAVLGGERVPAGTFTFFDTSASTFYHCVGILSTTSTTLLFYPTASTGGLGSQFLGLSASGGTTAAVASGDTIAGTITYEATT